MLDKDILNGFQEESNQLMEELSVVVERLEERTAEFPTQLMEEFSQKIDRIMGAAKTLTMMEPSHQGLQRIGKIAELCKKLGYKAAERKNPALVPIFAGFWADTLEVVSSLIQAVDDEARSATLAQSFSAVVQKRLEWLASKVLGDAKATGGALDVQALLKELGM